MTDMCEALEAAKSWIERWTSHVGNCRGGNECTCGRTAILAECAAALSSPAPDRLSEDERRAVENLRTHQEQCDMDGVMVKVSRQAVDETLAIIDRLSRQPETEPVAWIEFADNGNIRFWTSDPARAWTEGDNGRPLRKFTLAELVALVASPRLDREKVARIKNLLEAIRDNDPNDMAADAVTCRMVWQKEATDILKRVLVRSPSLDELVADEWQSLLDKDDRTSPEEYPDMVLITHDELREFAAAIAKGSK